MYISRAFSSSFFHTEYSQEAVLNRQPLEYQGHMFIHVEKAKYIHEYKIWLSFNDGAEGEIDLFPELYGEIFEPLKDVSFFKSFTLEGHTLSWVNGADFAPEFLREHIT